METLHIMSGPLGPTYLLVMVIVFYLQPLVVTLYCMFKLLLMLRHAHSRVQPPTTSPPAQLGFYSKLRTAYSVTIMLLCFILTRGIAIVISLCIAASGGSVSHSLDKILMLLLWTTPAIYPLIYIFRNAHLRRLLGISRPLKAEQYLAGFSNIDHAMSDIPKGIELYKAMDVFSITVKHMQMTTVERQFSTL